MGNPNSIFRHPKKQIFLFTFLTVVVYIFLIYPEEFPDLTDIFSAVVVSIFFRFDLIPDNIQKILVDIFLFFLSFTIWLAFFAQFVLPLHNGRERLQAVIRVFLYVTGRHGPAVTIRDGEIKERKQESLRRGPGVILLDTASAAVLRTPIEFTRAVGPGTVFTKRNESIAGVVDLHHQSYVIGPRQDEDPWADRGEMESDYEFNNRLDRKLQTRGLTRESLEIVPNITTVFRVDCEPGKGNTMFGFEELPVRKAIIHEGIDPNKPRDTSQRNVGWRWLPANMAADLWREYLKKFKLEQLFSQSKGTTAFETIQEMVNQRLTQAMVEELNDQGEKTGKRVPSREYIILKERGLQVLDVSITNLRFQESVETTLINRWRPDWMVLADDEEKQVTLNRSNARQEGEKIALVDFAEAASRLLGDHISTRVTTQHQAPNFSNTLEFLVLGTIDQCTTDPELHPNITNEKTELFNIIEWIRRHR
jgi:hypothetical protein